MAEFPCPEGCGETFKTNSAAYAHAYYCKAKAKGKGKNGDLDAIVEKLLPHIEEGIAGLQERVQVNILNGLTEILPKMVAQETQNIAGMIAAELKQNPNAGLSQILGQANEFFETPIGRLIFSRLLQPGSRGNIKEWRQGAGLALSMLRANKGDPDTTARMIKGFTQPYVGKGGNDLYRGMYEAAEMFAPSSKTGIPQLLDDQPPPEEGEK